MLTPTCKFIEKERSGLSSAYFSPMKYPAAGLPWMHSLRTQVLEAALGCVISSISTLPAAQTLSTKGLESV